MISKSEKLKILVVDDNPENIWPLIEDLERDYEITYATNGEKALNIVFSNNRPDLILLDVVMPDMDGYEVCRRLKSDEFSQDIPVLFLTGKTEAQDEVKGLELGAQDYILKPFSLPVVRARINSVLNLKKEMDRRQLLKTQMDQLNRDLELQIRQKKEELQRARAALRSYEKRYSSLFHHGPADKERKIILVVDDQPENIHILIETLEADYTVTYATNGEKALHVACSENRPDLILLDIMMPDMDGYEVCSRLKAGTDTRDIPIIFVTALGQEMDETKALQLGAVDFITKPFSLAVVDARIKTALRLKEAMDNRMLLTEELESLNRDLEQRVKDKTIELREAHEDVAASEKKYRTIYENAVEGIFQSTPDGRFLDANPSLARMFGYQSVTEFLSSVTDIAGQLYAHSQDRDEFKRILEQQGAIFDFESQFRKKNGDVIWGMLSATMVRNDADATHCYQGFLTDISKRKEAEVALKHNCDTQTAINTLLRLSLTAIPLEELLQNALDLILGIKWLCPEARGGIFLVENEPDVLVKKVCEGFSESLQKFCKKVPFGHCICGQAALTGKIQFCSHIDSRHNTVCPDMIPHGHFCIPILLGGKTLGVVSLHLPEGHKYDQHEVDFLMAIANTLASIIDRRTMALEKEKLEGQLRQAQKMEAIGTLAGGIAHDFNNILSAIYGYAEIAKFHIPAESEAGLDIQELLKAANRAKELVKQILTFSRRREAERRPLELNLIVKETLKLLRASFPSTIEIKQKIDQEIVTVIADPTQIHQVLMNLCTNAYHAMRDMGGILGVELDHVEIEKGDVKVASLHLTPGPYALLNISDTGHGMDQETMDHIFEPYFTTKKKGEGTGLGLAVVHGIVRSHGGHISVYSEPEKGTSVKVYLPKVTQPSEYFVEELHVPIPGGSEHVLVVDDEESIVDIQCTMLKTLGYKVTGITNPEEALQLFSAHPETFDLVITDMTMPHVTGTELVQRLCQIREDIPIILCTGFSELVNEKTAEKIGVRAFIMKPVMQKELAKIVRKVLDQH